jgi:hypothetical protein
MQPKQYLNKATNFNRKPVNNNKIMLIASTVSSLLSPTHVQQAQQRHNPENLEVEEPQPT